jgi:hypothetical protein
VTRFRVQASFLQRYEVQTVGARRRQEYWIPAEEQEDMHRHMVGPIEVIGEFCGRRPSRPAASPEGLGGFGERP